jgi:hypothetical protein
VTKFFRKYRMTPSGLDSVAERKYIEGFNNALTLAEAATGKALEESEFALRRSFLEADAIAGGRNSTFVCAPVIRDYCKKALTAIAAARKDAI